MRSMIQTLANTYRELERIMLSLMSRVKENWSKMRTNKLLKSGELVSSTIEKTPRQYHLDALEIKLIVFCTQNIKSPMTIIIEKKMYPQNK